MSKQLRIYYRMMRVHWAILLEYRGDTFFYMFGSFVYPLVTLAVWLAISAGGAVGGYGQRDFILYFLAVIFISRLNGAWDAWEIEQSIREGTLSSYLLRPSAYIHWRLSENLVYKLFYGVIMLVAWAIAWPFTDLVRISLAPEHVVTMVLSILMAMTIRYMLYFDIALFGFWTTRMLAIITMVESLAMFLSGRIAPYSLLPAWVRTAQDYTPFYWYLGFPVDVLTGKVTGSVVWSGLGTQALWSVGLILAYFVLWNRGMKKYGAVGG
ncbi:MAG: ABC-2 family transporter protein [Tumebacillaceae bacterium]